MKQNKYLFGALLGASLLASACVDADLKDALDYEDAYTSVDDADKHILGVYSSFMDLAEQMVVLNELRGDLMTITGNANQDLQQVDAKVYDKENPYLSTVPYYRVINECNDCLSNFKLMLKRHDMTQDEYDERYSDIAALRDYVYLQLAAQFGRVYYLTEPIASVQDIKKVSGAPISIDELLPLLIADMESLPTLKDYEESPLVTDPTTNGSVTLDGQRLSFYFAPKRLILADLYMWNGQYREAALLYRDVMSRDDDDPNYSNSQYYKCASTSTATNGISTIHSDRRYQAFFTRYFDPDDNSFGTTWPEMFSDAPSSAAGAFEWLWCITYTSAGQPRYPFINLFAPVADGGSYQLRPSDNCVANFEDLRYLRTNGAPFDTRGDSATYVKSPEGPVCEKYLYLYDPAQPTVKEGRWFLYRAAQIQLRLAECINRMGYPELAWAYINAGIAGYYGLTWPEYEDDGETKVNRETDPRNCHGNGHNLFHVQFPIMMGVCDNATDSAIITFDPAWMDASANALQGYYRRGPYRYHYGLRNGRSVMEGKVVSDFSAKAEWPLAEQTTKEDSIYLVEKILMDEAALELAHEGQRFPDLVRVARRMNRGSVTQVNGVTYHLTNDGMDGNAYMQRVMDRKAVKSQNVLGQPDYTDEASWFLPIE